MKGYRCGPIVLLLVACTPTPDVRATFVLQAVAPAPVALPTPGPALVPTPTPIPTPTPTPAQASPASPGVSAPPAPTPEPTSTPRPNPASTIIAGQILAGDKDGSGLFASFSDPAGLAVAPDGALWVADRVNHSIRRITFMVSGEAVVSTVAGSSSQPGFANGPGATARFDEPAGVAIDARGVVFVADPWNHCIRRIEPNGEVETLVGSETAGGEDGAPGTARFDHPYALALDTRGHLFVSERFGQTVRMVTLDAGSSRAVWVGTVAGSYDQAGSADGRGSAARFNTPIALAVDPAGGLYVAESGSCLLRHVVLDDMGVGTVSTLNPGMTCGFADGPVANARFDQPAGLLLTPDLGLLLTDASGGTLRRIAGQPPVVSTLLGGAADAPRSSDVPQTFNGIARAADGTLYVTDGNAIRRIRP